MTDGYLKSSDIRNDGLTKMSKLKERQAVCGGPDDRKFTETQLRVIKEIIAEGGTRRIVPWSPGRTFHALRKRKAVELIPGTQYKYRLTEAARKKYDEQVKLKDFLTR